MPACRLHRILCPGMRVQVGGLRRVSDPMGDPPHLGRIPESSAVHSEVVCSAGSDRIQISSTLSERAGNVSQGPGRRQARTGIAEIRTMDYSPIDEQSCSLLGPTALVGAN